MGMSWKSHLVRAAALFCIGLAPIALALLAGSPPALAAVGESTDHSSLVDIGQESLSISLPASQSGEVHRQLAANWNPARTAFVIAPQAWVGLPIGSKQMLNWQALVLPDGADAPKVVQGRTRDVIRLAASSGIAYVTVQYRIDGSRVVTTSAIADLNQMKLQFRPAENTGAV